MAQAHLIAVTGLKREARLLASPQLMVLAGGGSSEWLERELDRLAPGARGVISIGLAGALDPRLKPGDWVVADEVVNGERSLPADVAWTLRLRDALPSARFGAVAGSDVMLATGAAKAALRASTGAIAADMESHIAARAAERHRLPFAVARTISDAAGRGLPLAAQAGMKADGGMDLPGVLKALARRPWELPALVRTGVEAEAAFRALLRGRQLLGGTLGGPGPDLG
jgi:hopanoid-associated phosphorylase